MRIEGGPTRLRASPRPYLYYEFQNGHGSLNIKGESRKSSNTKRSILSRHKAPDQYPELTYLGNTLSKIGPVRRMDFRALYNTTYGQKPIYPLAVDNITPSQLSVFYQAAWNTQKGFRWNFTYNGLKNYKCRQKHTLSLTFSIYLSIFERRVMFKEKFCFWQRRNSAD